MELRFSNGFRLTVEGRILEMPRTYEAKHARVKEARKDNLTAAIDMVNSKQLTIAQASRRNSVPYTTLRDHAKEICHKVGAGRPTVLTMLKSWRLL